MPRFARPVVRPYRDDDLGRVVRLFEREGLIPVGPDGLTVDQATDLMGSDNAEVLVAEREGEIVGVAAGTVAGVLGSVMRVVGDDDVCGRLLDELEAHLADRGARTFAAAVFEDTSLRRRLADRGYGTVDGMVVVQREVEPTATGTTEVSQLGGRMVDRGLWDSLEGMVEVKQVIERRIILPLGETEMASRHGVAPPRAVVLFGPPGTGKTTFAKGIASRLGWPFVPVEPTQFADVGGGDGASRLAETFDRVLSLGSAVVFMDEIDDLASARHEDRRVSPMVTNEFLRQIPRFRDAPHHLLVCATNRVAHLDPAFRRPGRFDYILPVGPPDAEARAAIWRGFADEITDDDIDIDAIVSASERFTPADIEFAARKAAQLAFEREYFDDDGGRATTDDFLEAIERTRPTLTDQMIADFEHDVEDFARS